MFAKLFDRLVYALIGLIFGALAAAFLWIFLHYQRFSVPGSTVFDSDFIAWLKVVSGTFAVIGFVAKDRVGSAIGGTLDVAYKEVVNRPSAGAEVPTWLVVAVVIGVGALAWHFGRG